MPSTILDDYQPFDEFCKSIQKSQRQVQRMVSNGEGPPISYIGKTPWVYVPGAKEWLRKGIRRQPRRAA